MSNARHPGPGSGCQGCDPAVPMPSMTDPIFLCALCEHWMTLQGVSATDGLTALAKRRAALAVPDPLPAA